MSVLDYQNMSQEEIDADWDWEIAPEMFPLLNHDLLYHYYSGASARKVFKKDCVHLRLSKVSAYKDKMEGVAVAAYYDSALEELKAEKCISKEQYNLFKTLEVPNELFLPIDEIDGIDHWSYTQFEAFAICFSTERDDPYMFQNYGGKGKEEGHCVHLFGLELKDLETRAIANYSRIVLSPILYGHSAKDFIKEKILAVTGNQYLMKSYRYYIEDILWLCQYTVKLAKYSEEHEIRLLVFLPVNKREGYQDIELIKDDPEHIYFNIPKCVFCSTSHDPKNTQQENSAFIDLLKENKYDLLDIDAE